MKLEKKVVWITGASAGIGEALAYEFNKKGNYIILSARRQEELERVKNNCINSEETVRVLPLDLTKPETFKAVAEQARSFQGRIDMLINNGGVSQRAIVAEASMDSVRRVMEINFFGSAGITKEVLPGMIEQKSGRIVVISSVMGKIGTKYRSAYAASKHALHGWFDCLRQEVHEHNVKVTLVCPGYIKTDVSKNALTADGSAFNKMGDAHQKAMDPPVFAEKLVNKLANGKDEIYIGGTEILSIYVKRFFPGLLNKILLRAKVT